MSPNDRQLNLPKRGEKILEFWERNKIFEKTLAKTKPGLRPPKRATAREGGKPFVFYEGPPTANGSPGIHHFEGRAFKDVIPRYQTMRGRYVERKAGWDTHGLPVEIQVEKELGLKSKKDIERYGIAKFNAKCRETVWRYKDEFYRFTKRMGFWLDLEHPYITYEPSYIESLWWAIKEFSKKKLLYRDFKVVPWCPRCQTPLSTHELGLGYDTVKDRSLYVRFRVKARSREWKRTSILSWTTTPWTLPGNVALAINPREQYVRVPDPVARGHWVVLGNKALDGLVEKGVFPPEYRNRTMLDDVDVFAGKDMLGLEYEPPLSVKELVSAKSHRIYPADFVTMEEGTGVVHTAVMYGEDDYQLGTEVGLPKFHTVTETGHFAKEAGKDLAGLSVKDKDTEEKIVSLLRERGLLFGEEMYEHDYPFCWRCATPLLYYARDAWWVKVSAIRKRLLAANAKINWVPEHLKRGRFGGFLKEARDWAFSRERYWGTPLPIWLCSSCGATRVIGSLAELDESDPAPTTLILMRHGEALHNVKNLVNPSPQNDRDNVLTRRGQEDVAAAAKRLKAMGIDAVLSSPSFRARVTAKIAAAALGIGRIETVAALDDIYVGGFEGQPVAMFRAFFANARERFSKKPRGSENLREVRARVMAAVGAIHKKYAGKRVLVVTHGDPSWVVMAALQGLPEERYGSARYLKPAEFSEVALHNWPYDENGELNLHRPFVDAIRLVCERCRGEMRRVPEVVDVWFDSGAMPFAQHHYPFEHSRDLPFPADYICEGVDQTRGWFYTLLAVATLLGRPAPYRNVISVGIVLDKNGQKMSKSKGNVVDPFDAMAKFGADAIRWYFYTINGPGDPKRFDERDILLKLRGALSTLWNSFVFFDTYVRKLPTTNHQLPARHLLDRWVAAKLDALTADVTRRLNRYDIVGAARVLDQFIIEDFSNWYVRRSRRRFQHPLSDSDYRAAAATMGSGLMRLTELMAPFTPFLAEAVYQELKPKLGLREESVHLRKWPAAKGLNKNSSLLGGMAEVRRVAAAALALRAKASIKARQPLAKLKVKSQKLKVYGLLEVLKDEVNVKEVVVDPKIAGDVALDTSLSPELREEGTIREVIRNIQEMRRDGGFKPRDRIRIHVSGAGAITALTDRWRRMIEADAGADELEVGEVKSPKVRREATIDGTRITISIVKA